MPICDSCNADITKTNSFGVPSADADNLEEWLHYMPGRLSRIVCEKCFTEYIEIVSKKKFEDVPSKLSQKAFSESNKRAQAYLDGDREGSVISPSNVNYNKIVQAGGMQIPVNLFNDFAKSSLYNRTEAQVRIGDLPILLDFIINVQKEVHDPANLEIISKKYSEAFNFRCFKCGEINSDAVLMGATVTSIKSNNPSTTVNLGGSQIKSLYSGACPGCGGSEYHVAYDPEKLKNVKPLIYDNDSASKCVLCTSSNNAMTFDEKKLTKGGIITYIKIPKCKKCRNFGCMFWGLLVLGIIPSFLIVLILTATKLIPDKPFAVPLILTLIVWLVLIILLPKIYYSHSPVLNRVNLWKNYPIVKNLIKDGWDVAL